MRIALEMRIMAGSGVTMAPRNGNTFGTCAIEVLTNQNVHPLQWKQFTRALVRRWDAYRDACGGRLNVRPHWAKPWQHLWFRGGPAIVYLRHFAYRERLPEFREKLEAIAEAGGLTLQDLQDRLSNGVLDYLVFGEICPREGRTMTRGGRRS